MTSPQEALQKAREQNGDRIAHRQRTALTRLKRRHDEIPRLSEFATVHLGENTAALLRKLVPLGLVSATPGGSGRRQFFSITDAGRQYLSSSSEEKP